MRRSALVAMVVLLVAGSCGSPGSRTTSVPTTVTATSATTAASTTAAPTTAAPTTVVATTTTTGATTTTTTSSSTSVPAGPATVVTRGSDDRRVVALTFDAGADAGNTAAILDVLGARRIHATFGITGLWAQANPGLVRQIAAAGHQIVNHTWDHRSFTGYSTGTGALSAAQIDQELSAADALIRQLTGTGTGGWARPPYGDRNSTVDQAVGAAGYRYELMWTVDTLGWKAVPPETVVERSLAAAAPGEIILMHVGSASTDAAALPSLISALADQGYGFVTASAMV